VNYEEEAEVINEPPPPEVPPVFVFKKPDGTIPPRKNQPVAVVEYNDVADVFAREEPTLRKMTIGKKGELGINFSNDMEFPDAWTNKFKRDK